MKTSANSPLAPLSVSLRRLSTHTAERLPIASVAGVPVTSASRDQYEGVTNTFLEPSALSTANVDFGTLDKAQFERLHAEFGGQSKVPYQAGRAYEAEDFLPPALQALAGRDLQVGDRVVLPRSSSLENLPHEEDKPVDLTTNCHGTSWEAMQAFQGQPDLDIFFGDAVAMECQLENPDRFDKIAEIGPDQTASLDAQRLQPGDVVAFYNPGAASVCTLLHTAVYAGAGLFFEKPDTESADYDAPYRLATAEMVRRPVEKFLEGPAEARIYHPKESLPQAEETFAASNAGQIAEWARNEGQALTMPLLTQMELSLGGGFRGEYLTALVPQPLSFDESGRGIPQR